MRPLAKLVPIGSHSAELRFQARPRVLEPVGYEHIGGLVRIPFRRGQCFEREKSEPSFTWEWSKSCEHSIGGDTVIDIQVPVMVGKDEVGFEVSLESLDRMNDVEQRQGVKPIVRQIELMRFGSELTGCIHQLAGEFSDLAARPAVRVESGADTFSQDEDVHFGSGQREARKRRASAQDLIVRVRRDA
jgi:hypothetical protein